MTRQIIIEYEEFENLSALSKEDCELVLAARAALQTAYAPYSQFNVGSALRLEDGAIVSGSNQENVAYPSGMCAERVALFAAGSDIKKRKAMEIAVSAQKDGRFVAAMPCGACLQTMLEMEKRANQPLVLLIALGEERFMKIKGIKSLLPFAFYEF